ncbi:hypothetical protein DL93DRAFT_2170330 [Clavulina sp. PMI_390]|nr:hypothetical protein DL93DRAFT_2170330 [Clavulina sp. PMI_390]
MSPNSKLNARSRNSPCFRDYKTENVSIVSLHAQSSSLESSLEITLYKGSASITTAASRSSLLLPLATRHTPFATASSATTPALPQPVLASSTLSKFLHYTTIALPYYSTLPLLLALVLHKTKPASIESLYEFAPHRDFVMSRNFSACWTCRIRRKGGCEGPGPTGDCSRCIELNVECLKGYGERVPKEYRRPEIIEELSKWNRRKSSRRNPEKLLIGELVERLQVLDAQVASPAGLPVPGSLSSPDFSLDYPPPPQTGSFSLAEHSFPSSSTSVHASASGVYNGPYPPGSMTSAQPSRGSLAVEAFRRQNTATSSQLEADLLNEIASDYSSFSSIMTSSPSSSKGMQSPHQFGNMMANNQSMQPDWAHHGRRASLSAPSGLESYGSGGRLSRGAAGIVRPSSASPHLLFTSYQPQRHLPTNTYTTRPLSDAPSAAAWSLAASGSGYPSGAALVDGALEDPNVILRPPSGDDLLAANLPYTWNAAANASHLGPSLPMHASLSAPGHLAGLQAQSNVPGSTAQTQLEIAATQYRLIQQVREGTISQEELLAMKEFST